MSQVPAPWNLILDQVLGPLGAVVSLCVAVFFLWRLFREEQKENRDNFKTVGILSDAIIELGLELKAYREGAASVFVTRKTRSSKKRSD